MSYSDGPRGGKIRNLLREVIRQNLFRSVKYSISGFAGFLTLEFLTFLGLLYLGTERIFIIDAYAFFLAIALEFILNEHWTTRNEGIHHGGINGFLVRMMKFEFLNLLGNFVTLSIQYLLLIFLHLSPLIGNLIGSGVAFPVNYYLQMRNVWGINPLPRPEK